MVLILRKETLNRLSKNERNQVVGGLSEPTAETCPTQQTCPTEAGTCPSKDHC